MFPELRITCKYSDVGENLQVSAVMENAGDDDNCPEREYIE